ncbi:hypothetical protein V6N13_105952 [Hibiscus sabdariffa]|uniref:Uncharacterized protein n=1 Tax=Hibiscus sabdariffa TaxID=183260 RepID=A0ABR2EZ86_9ROSI
MKKPHGCGSLLSLSVDKQMVILRLRGPSMQKLTWLFHPTLISNYSAIGFEFSSFTPENEIEKRSNKEKTFGLAACVRDRVESCLLKLPGHICSCMQPRSEMNKGIFVARNREAAHGMIEPELFLGAVEQVQKTRVVQVGNGNHESCLFDFPDVDCNMAFWNVSLVLGLQFENLLGMLNHRRQTETHI